MHIPPTASGSNSPSNQGVASGTGSTTVSRRASSKNSSNSGPASKQNATTTGSSSSSSKWKLVRPWQPPSSNLHAAEAKLEDGTGLQPQHADSDEERDEADNEDDEDAGVEDSASSAVLASSSRMKKMHLEVVDVSSTSVSLSVFGQPLQESSNAIQHMDTSLGSTSSMANQTMATRRSRAASTSSERILSNPPQPPNISIKLNSAAWPHVFHTDASFLDTDSSRQNHDDPSISSSSILVWGLSPGQNYHIELGVFEDSVDDEDDANEPEDLSEVSDTEESVRAAASVRTLDATEPDVPPPPYSSHDPSTGSTAHNDAEASLRSMLDKLRITAKQKESALQSSISSMRRANDKLTREDQRHRQRIHMLEDSTSRLREVAADEDAEYETIQEQVEELEATEKRTLARLERRRSQLEEVEKQFKEEVEKEDAELSSLKERLDKVAEREEEVLAKKLKLERELLPTYNIQLATLEADLRRLVDDHRRRYPYQHHVPPHAFGTHLPHSGSGLGHTHIAHSHSVRGGRERMQARAVQHQQAQQQQVHHQQHHTLLQSNEALAQGEQRAALSNGLRTMEVPARSPQLTPPGNMPAEIGTEGSVRPSSSLGASSQAEDNAAGGVAGKREQETGRANSGVTGDAISGRPGSRFAWSSANSWASKVAGGGGSKNSGVPKEG